MASPGFVLDADSEKLRFQPDAQSAHGPEPMLGTGWVEIIHTGSSAVAQVHLDAPNEPGAHYSVGLIEEPRPSSATCGPGDPGTAFTGLDTDAAGVGTATVQDGLRSGHDGCLGDHRAPQRSLPRPGRVLHL